MPEPSATTVEAPAGRVRAGVLLALAALLLAGPPVGCGGETDAAVRAMTFNLKRKQWRQRRDAVAALLRELRPEILALQEATAHQVDWLRGRFPHYRGLGEHSLGGREGEFAGLLVDEDRFAVRESGSFWLSEEPARAASVGWDAAMPRPCAWARLRDRRSRRELLVYGAHLDHAGAASREEGARLIAAHLRAVSPDGAIPALLLGDLNADPGAPPLVQLRAAGLRDSFDGSVASDEAVTYRPEDPAQPGRRIDYVLHSAHWSVEQARVVPALYGRQRLSDHDPVFAVLRLR